MLSHVLQPLVVSETPASQVFGEPLVFANFLVYERVVGIANPIWRQFFHEKWVLGAGE